MTKVITYGTFDLLHRGHVRLLERAKALGDRLVVGVTSDDYDRQRGKINAAQPLMARIDAVRATGLADEIVVEEYEGQKIDDVRRLGIDVFTVGSDWQGQFDYLNEYCRVVYLPRTEGISSSEIRAKERTVRMGFFGRGRVVEKYRSEAAFVNGLSVAWACGDEAQFAARLNDCDAVYVQSHPSMHTAHIRLALEAGKHVLCESPVALSAADCDALFALAASKGIVLMDAIKTAYATAYGRMLLLVKSGKIGRVVSIDATCTSLQPDGVAAEGAGESWNARCAWAPAALLAVMQILGTDCESCNRTSFYAEGTDDFDVFSKFDFRYREAVATVKVGKGVKSEGDLVVSGTKGYVYIPAPWWKTDYFEVRFENPIDNRRYFYQLDGEGIRQELVAFVRCAADSRAHSNVTREISVQISQLCGEEHTCFEKPDHVMSASAPDTPSGYRGGGKTSL